jgi:hypothetical protein
MTKAAKNQIVALLKEWARTELYVLGFVHLFARRMKTYALSREMIMDVLKHQNVS